MIRLTAAVTTVAVCFAAPSFSSSADAWEEFRSDVRTACEAIAPKGTTVFIEVSPFGSESYGAAIVYQLTESGLDRYVCIYDKQTQKAEITTAFPAAGN